MKLKNKYVVGCLVMWYEVKMLPEYLDSCKQMVQGIENPENVTFDFCINFQEYFEKCENIVLVNGQICKILQQFLSENRSIKVNTFWKCGPGAQEFTHFNGSTPFYNIAKYRRDLCYKNCEICDYILWGETDSLWPKQTLEIIEHMDPHIAPKNIISFGYRVNWDPSWNITRHPLFEYAQFQDNDEWVLNNEASEKSYMTLERMNEINAIDLEDLDIRELNAPKADGSCLIISSELIKSGVNIPHALLHCGEDESFLRMAKLVMGNDFRQYLVKNILRVHNRRHPKKRMYIKNEDNPRGFCDHRKGDWWKRLEDGSKFNLENLRKQVKFKKIEEVI